MDLNQLQLFLTILEKGGLSAAGRELGLSPATVSERLAALAASAEDACAVALETGATEYHFVRRYLERGPQLPLNLRQVDPLIRQLTLYRELIESRTQTATQENP